MRACPKKKKSIVLLAATCLLWWWCAAGGVAAQQQQLPAITVLSDEDVLRMVERVFPPSDGSTLQGGATAAAAAAAVAHLHPVLSRVGGTGCPAFTVPAEWTHGGGLLEACLWAVVGKFAADEVTMGGAFASFVLDTRTGAVVRGESNQKTQQSIAVLSALVVMLLFALGMLMLIFQRQQNQHSNSQQPVDGNKSK